MWPFINKVFELPNGGTILFICFAMLLLTVEQITLALIKRAKAPKEK